MLPNHSVFRRRHHQKAVALARDGYPSLNSVGAQKAGLTDEFRILGKDVIIKVVVGLPAYSEHMEKSCVHTVFETVECR